MTVSNDQIAQVLSEHGVILKYLEQASTRRDAEVHALELRVRELEKVAAKQGAIAGLLGGGGAWVLQQLLERFA